MPGGGGYLGQVLLGMCRWHLRTLPHYSLSQVYFVANYTPHLSHFWGNVLLTLKVPRKCDPIQVTLTENA